MHVCNRFLVRANQVVHINVTNMVFVGLPFLLLTLLLVCCLACPVLYVVAFAAAETPSPVEAETYPSRLEGDYYDDSNSKGVYGSAGYEYGTESYPYSKDYGRADSGAHYLIFYCL